MSKVLPSLSLLALLCFGCETSDSSVVEPTTTSRQFSAALRTTCMPIPSAGRTGAAGPVLDVESTQPLRLGIEIYDTLGAKVASSTQVVTTATLSDVLSADPKTFMVMWNGLGPSGTPAPSGHYFLFLEARDSAGALLRRDSTCIGVSG